MSRGFGAAATAALLAVNAATLLAAGSVEAASSPSITLTPAQGPQGTTVRVNGSGFCGTASGCSTVQISFARIPEATTPAASDGTFSVTFKVPGGLSFGQQNVQADQTTASGGQLSANKSFFLTISQQSPPPAQSPATSPTPAPGGSPSPTSPGSPGASPTATSESPPANPQATPASASASGKPTAFPWWALVVVVLIAGAAAGAALVWRRFRE